MNNNYLKEIPDPKFYPVLPPDMDYIYFDKADEYPFEENTKEFSLVNSWWLAESAYLVYAHPGFARMAFKIAGFTFFKFFQGRGTECMAAWNDTTMIITFRGTELKSLSTLHEIKTDLNTVTVEFPGGGMVHKGFLLGLEEIWEGANGLKEFIDSQLKSNKNLKIWVTGHSLGGALAGLCFSRIPKAMGLYIFGSPRVGNQDFVNLFKNRPVWRFEHGKDPIPQVPPKLASLNLDFSDIGCLKYININGQITDYRPEISSEDYKVLVKNTFNTQIERRKDIRLNNLMLNEHIKESISEWKNNFKLFKDDTSINITDHMPIFYTIKIWNFLIS